MTKKLFAILAVLLVSVMAFAACSSGAYNFTALQDNPTADDAVANNGGTVVQKGKYTYFVNGAVVNSETNTFGSVVKGAIARVPTADIGKEDAKIEIVVPKIFYAADASSAGFYVFGTTLYYTTPSGDRDKNGNVLSSRLDFMSVNLDGTGTKKLFTVENNAVVFGCFEDAESNVRINYVDNGTIYSYNVATNAKTEVAKDVTSSVLDRKTGEVYFTENVTFRDYTNAEINRNYNVLKKADVTGTVTTVKKGIAENAPEDSYGDKYSVVKAANAKVYYTLTNTETSKNGLYEYDDATKAERKLSETGMTSFETYQSGIVYVDSNSGFLTYLEKAASGYKTVAISKASGATLLCVKGDEAYYVASNILYRADLTTERKESVALTKSTQTTSWATFQLLGDKVFFFNNSATLSNYLYYATTDGDGKIKETRLAILTEKDAKTEKEGK